MNTENKSKTKMASPKQWVAENKGIVIAVLIAAGLIFGAYQLRKEIIVATVNGTPIYRWQLINELEKQGGQQVLDSLVTEELISQEAENKGVQVTEQEVNAAVDELKNSLTGQGQDLDTLLEQQNVSQQEFRDQIKFQVQLEKLAGSSEVTEEEINEIYEQQKEMYGEDVTEEQAKESIKQQLQGQKQNTAIQELINTLKEAANISKLLTF